jgi:hypothetical protein
MIMELMKKPSGGVKPETPSPFSGGRKAPLAFSDLKRYAEVRHMLVSGDKPGIFKAIAESLPKDPELMQCLIRCVRMDTNEPALVAVNALSSAARSKVDISSAVPALVCCLRLKNGLRKHEAAMALMFAAEQGTGISIAIPHLIACMGESKALDNYADFAISHAARNGDDVRAAIDALAKRVEERNPEEQSRAIEALGNAALNGADISEAIPALRKCMDANDRRVTPAASWAFGCAALQKGDGASAVEYFGACMRSGDKHACKLATQGLRKVGDQRLILPLLSELIGMLEHNAKHMREQASDALRECVPAMRGTEQDFIVAKLQALIEGGKYQREMGMNSEWFADVNGRIRKVLADVYVALEEAA